MNKLVSMQTRLVTAFGAAALGMAFPASADPFHFEWKTVVDNNANPPGIASEKFFSYNQPSLNDRALVVFRARAKKPSGGQGGGEPTRGIFTRGMASAKNEIKTIASNKPPYDVVPYPNNITQPGPATYNEFPAFPRIDKSTSTVAFRGQSQPSWTDPDDGKLGGTSGVYANPSKRLTTGVRNLETAAGFSQYWVPDVATLSTNPTRFDQFPGGPTISDKDVVSFKGNYTDDGTAKTGIFFRGNIGGTGAVKAVAWTGYPIPDTRGNPTATPFGSTAPPSSASGKVVFAGFDNEENPTAGGIYLSQLAAETRLRALVSIGTPVPGLDVSAAFTRFGEALSFDGRYLTFWGAWGAESKDVVLTCPKDGNSAVIQACIDQDTQDGVQDGIYTLSEPVNQGIFLFDTQVNRLRMVARTGDTHGFTTFLFWGFTGAPPGVGGGDEGGTDDREPPRWRNSAFTATSRGNVAFKAMKADRHGIYVKAESEEIRTVLDTTMKGNVLDKKTILLTSTGSIPLSALSITTLGLERDGFRANRLAISASMADPTNTYTWAGIYLGKMDD